MVKKSLKSLQNLAESLFKRVEAVIAVKGWTNSISMSI